MTLLLLLINEYQQIDNWGSAQCQIELLQNLPIDNSEPQSTAYYSNTFPEIERQAKLIIWEIFHGDMHWSMSSIQSPLA